jgi:hypothetical protein
LSAGTGAGGKSKPLFEISIPGLRVGLGWKFYNAISNPLRPTLAIAQGGPLVTWTDKLLDLCRRYGKPVKVAASSILGAILPGSPAVVELVERAFDTAEEKGQDHWEVRVDEQLEASAEDLERLGQVLDLLQGELQHLTAQVARLPEFAQQIIETALTSDPRCQEAARRLENLAGRFDRLERQQERLLAGQADMAPLLRRTIGVCDYIDELRAGGFSIEVFAELLRGFQKALRLLGRGEIQEAERALEAVAAARPMSAAATVALAASQAAGHNFLQAEQTLTRAIRLKPHDPELSELHRRATSLSRRGETPTDRLAPARRQLRDGDTLDGWKLEQLIGHGGWGLVFRASRDGRTMAIKIMHAELSADALFVERFKREIFTLARLGKHPHLVEIDSFGYATDHGCWYFVMEWVEGVTLDQHLTRHGALPWQMARELFLQLSGGLAEAHRRGIVHRDIKPANIMLRPDGRAVLVDFGLALETDGGLTRTGRSAGYTALFAAPEQIRKNQADARSDVYSLAASLYYALMHDDPDRREPHRYKPRHVPEPAQDLLTRALDNDPVERPADAAAFHEGLVGLARPLIADLQGRGDVLSLEEAIRKTPAGGQVIVRPGHYYASMVLDRAVEIIGDGPRDSIIIESETGNCLTVRGEEVTLRSLTLRGRGQRKPAVEVLSGRLNLENSAITSEASACISASSASARLSLKGCLLHESKEQGLLLTGGASATLEDCEVARTRGPGIEVQQGCSLALQFCLVHDSASSGLFLTSKDVTVDRCQIHDNALANVMVKRGGAPAIRDSAILAGKQVGLFFLEGGGGLVEGCEIAGNALAGIETKHGSNPTIRRCHIHDGKQSGILASEGGRGTFEDCDVAANALSGIESKNDGNPVLHRCRIRENRANGLYVYEKGGGVFEECDIFGNLLQGVSVKDESKPILRNVRCHDNKECGLLIHGGGAGLFEGCEVHANGLANVEIKQESEPVLRSCRIHSGKQAGLFVCERGRGLIEGCDVFANGLANVEIKSGGNPTLKGCNITDGRTSGLYVYADGHGTLEDCNIRDNRLQGVAIKQGGDPSLINCRIHGGKECGVFVYEKGTGVLEGCDIFNNGLANVEIKEGGMPILRRCKVRDGKVCGILIWVSAGAQVEECEITGNAYAGIEIKQGANPTFVRCRIAGNGGSAFYIHEQGGGVIENCDLRNNKLGAWDVGVGCRVRRQGNIE